MRLDPVNVEILNNHFGAITNEMGYIIWRTAFTAYVKETWDFAQGLATVDGELFAFSKDIGGAPFIGLPLGDVISSTRFEEGDILICNDPYTAPGICTHLPDLHLVKPLFHDGRLVCCDVSEDWTAVARRHWARAGVDGKISLKLAPAADTLRELAASSAGTWDWVFIDADKTGYATYVELAHALLPAMIDRRWGRIINITGKSEPEHLNAAFSAKAGIHAWAKGLSREVGQFGITVNSIPPGRIMSEQIRRNYPEDYRKHFAETEIPVRYWGEPEDLAVMAVWLALPLARYVTGAVIPVDGGLRRYQF